MEPPIISIVLPTYNGSKYIRKSIESCLSQTFSNFELIIVNDCSTDNTNLIISEYANKDSRVRIIHNEFNKKLPLSLNTGFQEAKGKYFTWTSDDNYYAPAALESLLIKLEKNPVIDLVYSDYSVINDKDEIISVRKFGDINLSFNKWLGCGACFLYKKEIHYKNNGYNPAAFLIEDYDFFVRAFLNFRFSYLPLTDLYYYREHDSSLTSTQSAVINDISKIFLERNLVGLEKKLNNKETEFLYRKFAVYYAVTKNNINKYNFYLGKLQNLSFKQALITVFYVLLVKFLNAISVGFSGVFFFLKGLFTKV